MKKVLLVVCFLLIATPVFGLQPSGRYQLVDINGRAYRINTWTGETDKEDFVFADRQAGQGYSHWRRIYEYSQVEHLYRRTDPKSETKVCPITGQTFKGTERALEEHRQKWGY